MKRPQEIELSREEGEALIERLETGAWTPEDRQVLAQVVRLYFWLLFMLQESKLSLKRFRVMIFGKSSKTRKPKPPKPVPDSPDQSSEEQPSAASQPSELPVDPARPDSEPESGDASSDTVSPEPRPEDGHRPGHGRLSADDYSGAERVECHHETLSVGDQCPACGIGWLYSLPPGRTLRINGHAVLSAIRYEMEKLRCSACGERFTAALPPEAGRNKYSPRARSALSLSRYFLGVPFYRLEAYQALVGVPVPDATQWDQVERVADCAYPVFEHLVNRAAQGELIYQDDTPVRILSLIKENQELEELLGAGARTGMQSTALVVEAGGQTICLYFSGRAHAGENLKAVLTQREADRDPPLVMSDALSHNEAPGVPLVRCHCLAHGRRKFTEIESAFPEACQEVVSALKQVFDHEDKAQQDQMSAPERLAYHQTHSAPIMDTLHTWMEEQVTQRNAEPNSSLGKALRYWLDRWQTLTQFLRVSSAPLENNTAERALKLIIRQRKNSLFYATPHSAYVASLLTSLIATCVQAGVNAMEYLVALQDNRTAVFANPALWLPWTYTAHLSPT